ncbi:MAG: O-antigen ligase family protein, partial [Planctomycetota bacterium]
MHSRSAVMARIRHSKKPLPVPEPETEVERWAESASTQALRYIPICLTLLSIIVLPWMLGGVYERVIALTGIVAAVALVSALMHSAASRTSIPGSIGIILLLAAFAWGIVQMVPLPVDLVKSLSPESVSIRESLAGPVGEKLTLSIYPLATRADLARLWVGSAFLLIGYLCFYKSSSLRWLLGIAMLNGFCVAIFGVFQRILWDGRLFWIIPSPSTRSFGPFVNHNNAGGFLCISAGFAAAMLFYRWAGNNHWVVDRSNQTQMRATKGRFGVGSLRVILAEMTDATNLAMFIGISGVLAGVLMSLSRGAAVGAVAGILGALIVMRLRGIRKQWLMLLVLIVGAGFMITWTRSADMIQARISSVFDERNMDSIRFLHWMDDLDMAKDYWLTGAGIGTYRYANRPYQEICNDGWFLYSENQYLESLLVGGIPGVLILGGLLLIMLRAIWVLARTGGRENTTVAMLGRASRSTRQRFARA